VFTEAITADGPFLEIAGGNDQLPGAFKSRLKRFLRKQAVVQSIDQSGESVTVTYRQFGAVQTISADRVVCALPFPVLNNIPVNPPFSDAKQQAVSGLKLTPVTRTYLQFSSRSWQQSNLDGSSITDLEIQNTYSPTETQADPRGILTSYAGGQNALSLASLTESNRQSLVLKQMSNMFGGLGQPELGTSVIWQDDPLSQGAFTYFQPGQMTTLLPAAQQPEGRIHFAGEHTSAWHGWMNGALESGNRVAAEINAAANSRVITIRTEPAG
ncbi:MAG TPA: FAD-dependent oxidoreductase, partial [Blastocatellia bacterium]|nr:FAD-dependent oxidoreductase [Blastocatellia bacterium]